ncbi:MAG: HD-GYP domain-containing protein [Candidatus Caenarcaniphilales bacterium]|nr:HD-GYP domain-containing protein [Candidatus Caenarcaniphilales bacterium]
MEQNSKTNSNIKYYEVAKALIHALELKDPYTSGHSFRVYKMAKELGKLFDLDEEKQFSLEGGALLHDIGKIGIRDSILLKPASLTFEEFRIMKTHVVLGADIISQCDSLKHCLEPVLFHHERIDGKGYPHGLKGEEIPLIAKITCVVDSYDAMTTNRVYTPARTPEEALKELQRCSGAQFDHEVIEAFSDWWQDKNQKQENIIEVVSAGDLDLNLNECPSS